LLQQQHKLLPQLASCRRSCLQQQLLLLLLPVLQQRLLPPAILALLLRGLLLLPWLLCRGCPATRAFCSLLLVDLLLLLLLLLLGWLPGLPWLRLLLCSGHLHTRWLIIA
jgi:hypothetical protein